MFFKCSLRATSMSIMLFNPNIGDYQMTTILTHATTSAAFTYVQGSNNVQETWLDGSGKVINYSTSTPRGRYLVSLVARKGFSKTK